MYWMLTILLWSDVLPTAKQPRLTSNSTAMKDNIRSYVRSMFYYQMWQKHGATILAMFAIVLKNTPVNNACYAEGSTLQKRRRDGRASSKNTCCGLTLVNVTTTGRLYYQLAEIQYQLTERPFYQSAEVFIVTRQQAFSFCDSTTLEIDRKTYRMHQLTERSWSSTGGLVRSRLHAHGPPPPGAENNAGSACRSLP